MKKVILLLVFIFPFITFAEPLKAPFFYSVEKNNVTSYILGTFHAHYTLSDFPDVVMDQLDQSDQVAVELNLLNPNRTEFRDYANSYSFLSYGERLSDKLGRKAWKKVKKLLSDYPTEALNALSAGGIQSLLQEKVISDYYIKHALLPQPSMDTQIARDAQLTQKPIRELDLNKYFKNQIPTLNQSHYNQLSQYILKPYKEIYNENEKCFDDIQLAYLQGDLKLIEVLTFKCSKHFVVDAQVSKRNKAWMPLLEEMFQDGNAFVAFGAAHLPGENGILNLLKKRGYKVKRWTQE